MNDIQAKPSHYREAGEINLLSPLTLRDVTSAQSDRHVAHVPIFRA